MTDSRQAATPQAGTTPQAEHEDHEDHGHSLAAWTGVVVIMFGFLISSIGVGFTSLWVTIVGFVVVAIGCATWKVLSSMGYGSAVH
jgi:hypothetical protein